MNGLPPLTTWNISDGYGICRPPNVRNATRSCSTHFDLWERRNDKVVDFSKGMKAKLAVARTLIHRPPLIFLDEPTEGLDPVAAVSLRDDLVRLATKEKVTVFLTSHNMPEVEKICSQIGIIRKGRLIAFGSPGDISSEQEDPGRDIRTRVQRDHDR